MLSALPEDAIRWILDDALAFVKREVKRGNTYQGIILDPPAFGRGAKGEVWHIEQDLPRLMEGVAALLASGGFLLLNGYAAGYTPTSFLQLVASHFPDRRCEYGELFLSGGDRLISEGIYVRSLMVLRR
jgi:23S rRNA (cytosine1962-C5)-methyltransferase